MGTDRATLAHADPHGGGRAGDAVQRRHCDLGQSGGEERCDDRWIGVVAIAERGDPTGDRQVEGARAVIDVRQEDLSVLRPLRDDRPRRRAGVELHDVDGVEAEHRARLGHGVEHAAVEPVDRLPASTTSSSSWPRLVASCLARRCEAMARINCSER